MSRAPQEAFHSPHYLRINARRLEHLASLNLQLRGLRVLEAGAGIGDHTHYFLDRDCDVTLLEGRLPNVEILRELYPNQQIVHMDMENPASIPGTPFAIVYCSGLLYHLNKPAEAIRFLSEQCAHMMIVETCVSFGSEAVANPVPEDPSDPTQAMSGGGCRPTRLWLLSQMRQHFPYVYFPRTQPNHEEFPLDWNSPEKHHSEKGLARAIVIGSRAPIANDLLSSELLDVQIRHE
jgi:hypothetical protein